MSIFARMIRITVAVVLVWVFTSNQDNVLVQSAEAQDSEQPAQAQDEKQELVKKRKPVVTFNRKMKNKMNYNAPPPEDGIHDVDSPGTHALQPPKELFDALPSSRKGNKVDWVKAIEQGYIAPRYELDDPDAESFTMDLNIVREVKGSMPNVLFPHLQHTQWLDCSNCHDAIFIPEKGANSISMAAILLGQKCGVCHGKVAFPIGECRRCHSQPKTPEQIKELAQGTKWRKK